MKRATRLSLPALILISLVLTVALTVLVHALLLSWATDIYNSKVSCPPEQREELTDIEVWVVVTFLSDDNIHADILRRQATEHTD